MNDKLNTLSIFLENNNFISELSLVQELSGLTVKSAKKNQLSAAMNKLISENPDLFPSSPSRAVLHEVTRDTNLPAEVDEDAVGDSKLQDWQELLSAINGNKKFNYEVTLSEISKALNLEGESIRGKGNVPPSNAESRMEIIKLLESKSFGPASESKADDQYSRSLQAANIDFERLNSSVEESVKHILSGLSSSEVEDIKGKVEEECISKEAFIKGIGTTVIKSLPIIGVLISLPLFVKNLTEAYNNSVTIIEELPLSKYGLSSVGVISPTFIADGTLSHIENEVEKNSDNPKNLMEILEIVSVLKAFHLDMVFTITNGVALILDIISLILWSFPDIISKAAAIIYSVADFIIQLVILFGIEKASEYASESFWSAPKERMREISEEAISEIQKKAA